MSSKSRAAVNKAVDESHLKILRELSHLEWNRHCFECGQRGPTYVDVTIGSFVCMTCSGLLRGITPPHRVKSISMSSFSPEEVELLKGRGNEYCRKVWLATHTSRDAVINLSENDADRRSFLSSKYEQKRWYVDPSRIPGDQLAMIQAQNVKALSSCGSSSGSGSASSVQRSPSLSSSASSANGASPVLNNLRSTMSTSHTLPDIKPLSQLLNTNNTPINFINNLSEGQGGGKIINTSAAAPVLTKDPWAGTNGSTGDFQANFANFDANFDEAFSSTPNFVTNFDKPLAPMSNSNNSFINNNNNINSSGSTGGTTMASGSEDRYAALKDLDELFKSGGDSSVASKASNVSSGGMTASMSVPVNLSSSSWGANPFAAVGTSPSNQTVGNQNQGWGGGGGFNPFAGTVPSTATPFSNSFNAGTFNPFAAASGPAVAPTNPFL